MIKEMNRDCPGKSFEKPMNDRWIKLYAKFGDSDILFDDKALRVFMWLLTHVDRDGKRRVSKYLTAESLRMKPTTFYDALKRLKTKYKVLSMKPTTNLTEISLLNWDKYQSTKTQTDQKPTTARPAPDTSTRIENKDINITNVILPEEPEALEEITLKNDEDPPKVRKPHPYAEIITYCKERQQLETNFVNYAKQTMAVKKILSAGYSLEDIRFVIGEMAEDPYWHDAKFDMMSVSNQMYKYMNRIVMFDKKGAARAKYS